MPAEWELGATNLTTAFQSTQVVSSGRSWNKRQPRLLQPLSRWPVGLTGHGRDLSTRFTPEASLFSL